MDSVTSESFETVTDWHIAVLDGEDVILRGRSALECLGLVDGFICEYLIEVFSKHHLKYDNIECKIVDTFDNIEYVEMFGLKCTTANFTFSDMLSDFENIDRGTLVEGLADYYLANNNSFNNLKNSVKKY